MIKNKGITLFSLVVGMILFPVFSAFAQCLIAEYPFSGNADDATGSANNGVVYGPFLTTDRNNIMNEAYAFDGVDDYISINNNTFGNFGFNSYTISFWLQTTFQGSNYQSIMSKRAGCSVNSFWQVLATDGFIMVNNSQPNQQATGSIAINDGQWHHVAVIRNNTTLKVYIDGQIDVAQGGYTYNNSDNINASLTFGISPCVGVDGSSSFSGKLDDIKFFNCALNANDILTLADGTSPCTVFVYDTVTITQTNTVTVYDTVSIIDTNTVTIYDSATITSFDTVAVTDTLLIDLVISVNPLRESKIRVYPNPTNNLLIIDNSNHTQMTNYTLKIVSDLGQEVFSTPCNVPTLTVDLSQFTSTGLYFLRIINPIQQVLEEKKIVVH